MKYLNFSKREIKEMGISVVVLSVVFSSFTIASVMYSFIAVGFGFVFHELAHRFMAQRYGFHAEYRMWVKGLLFALFLAVMSGGSFVFAAPGAVVISGAIPRDKHGKIALAGPVVNVVLVLVFSIILFVAGIFSIIGFGAEILFMICSYGILVNLFLAAFNMLPFPPMDGASVFAWNKFVWAITGIPLILLMFSLMFLL